ncbi:SDR family NAD(P)-dependent oxidoreductase [Kineococcus glutinatus]|uniref:SDR family NAD(P)-dependent oxidoreductase n=1 Tax=Kineococcus glutinatus TaxID=1070872 RepID=UPI0031E81AA3
MPQTLPDPTRWTAADVPDQSGRTALVTGASSGLGAHLAHVLAARGATVVMAVRDRAKGERVRRAILDTGVPGALELHPLDLEDLDAVRSSAAALADRPLDLLVANAGIAAGAHRLSPQGHEIHLATNHLGHFALTGLLLPALERGRDPRVVTVTSGLHRLVRRFDPTGADPRPHQPGRAYARSKLANALTALELDRRLRAAGSPVTSVLAHPGMARTPMQDGPGSLPARLVVRLLVPVLARSTEQGTLPLLHAATAPGLPGGVLVGPTGPVTRTRVRYEEPSRLALDTDLARRLWTASVRLTGVEPVAATAR